MGPKLVFGNGVFYEVPEKVLHFILDYLHVNAIKEETLSQLLQHGRYEFYSKVQHIPIAGLGVDGMEVFIKYLDQLERKADGITSVWKDPEFQASFHTHIKRIKALTRKTIEQKSQ
jgi:hypothetical protein